MYQGMPRGTKEFLALKLAVERDGWSLKLRVRPFPSRGRLAGRTWPTEESVSETAEIRRKANSLAFPRNGIPCVSNVIFNRVCRNVPPPTLKGSTLLKALRVKR